MELNNLLSLLEKNFPKEVAKYKSNDVDVYDTVGLLVEGKKQVSKVAIALDITNEIILQAYENEVDTLITHHPLYFGDKDEWFLKHKFDKAKYELLLSLNMNLICIHTNADFNDDSIAYNMAIKLGLVKVERISNNKLVRGYFIEPAPANTIKDLVSTKLEIDYPLRTNIDQDNNYKFVTICSGACGDSIYNPEILGGVFIPGEMKHHHWVFAKEQNIKVLETGHFSEKIFKEIVKTYLEQNSELEIVLLFEENEYK